MGIQDAIRSIPAKPGIAIAVVVTILFGAWHFYTGWRACEHRARAAEEIRIAVAIAQEGEIVDLAEMFAFAWDELRVLRDYHPSENALDCPFGNHWSLEMRRTLAREGNLTALVLSHEGRAVALIEYVKEWGDFQTGEVPLPREDARFRISRSFPPQLLPIRPK